MNDEPTQPTEKREAVIREIAAELDRAYAKHGREQWGRHEFYGIIREEFDEMWGDIKADADQETLRKEIVQVAAMCFRYLETGDRYREPVARSEQAAEVDRLRAEVGRLKGMVRQFRDGLHCVERNDQGDVCGVTYTCGPCRIRSEADALLKE